MQNKDRSLTVAALCCCLLPVRAEIIDRVAVSVDRQVITESEVIDEVRITAFLNGEKPDLSGDSRRRTADRLVEQLLIRHEMDLTHYPQPEASAIQDRFQEIRSRYPSEAALQAALTAYRITLEKLEKALLRQAATLQFIDLRFKPEVQVAESELMNYFDQVCKPEMQRRKLDAGLSYDEQRAACEEELRGKLVDKRVDAWLRDVHTRAHIRYEEDAFQ